MSAVQARNIVERRCGMGYCQEMETENQLPPIEVPYATLSEDLLSSVIEHFVLREGTDYGAVEASLETKILQVRKQVAKGDVRVVFDPNTETVTLMTKRDWLNLNLRTKE